MLPKMYEIRATNSMYKCKPNLLFIFFNLNHCHFCLLTLQMKLPCRRCAVHFAEARNVYTVNQDGVQEGRQNMNFFNNAPYKTPELFL